MDSSMASTIQYLQIPRPQDATAIGKILLLQDAGEEERDFEVHGGVTSSLWFVGVLKTRDDEDSFTIQDIGVLITAMSALGAWLRKATNSML